MHRTAWTVEEGTANSALGVVVDDASRRALLSTDLVPIAGIRPAS